MRAASAAGRAALVACRSPSCRRYPCPPLPRPGGLVVTGAAGVGRGNASGGASDGSAPPATTTPTSTSSPSTPSPTPTPRRPPAPRGTRLRLDEACLAADPSHSRSVYQSWIARGKVFVDGKPVTKAGAPFKVGVSKLDVRAEAKKFVCRGGTKLEAALEAWAIDVVGLAALDCGLSTGGFADCLLQRGAAAVLGVDVGYGQVDGHLRNNARLHILERANMRHVTREDLPPGAPAAYDLATLDVSFISVLKILPAVAALMKPAAQCVVLVKPQFEAGRDQVGKGGVIRDPDVHRDVMVRVIGWASARGYGPRAWIDSPVTGADGNREFLLFLEPGWGGPAPAPPGGDT